MDSVIPMTKQGVRNLNNLGPKKKKVVATEAQPQAGEAGEAAEQVQGNEQSAPQTDAPAASE
ncbi:MAG: hypothetical protein ABIS92_06105 [Polyangia bacterium]